MSLENYIKNKHALCYVFPEKKKDNEDVKTINSIKHAKELIANITNQKDNREKIWFKLRFKMVCRKYLNETRNKRASSRSSENSNYKFSNRD